MTPTDKYIKVTALSRLLKDREEYLKEVEEKENELKIFEEEIKEENKNAEQDTEINQQGEVSSLESIELDNFKLILDETRNLLTLSEQKIKEVADDLRNFLHGEFDNTTTSLLQEADQITEKVQPC